MTRHLRSLKTSAPGITTDTTPIDADKNIPTNADTCTNVNEARNSTPQNASSHDSPTHATRMDTNSTIASKPSSSDIATELPNPTLAAAAAAAASPTSRQEQQQVTAAVDVEKQCGVLVVLPSMSEGRQCTRSLTCKAHSMGAKRAVPGRSAPYDILLREYQLRQQKG